MLTLPEWTFIFSAATTALLIVGGIWLKTVVDQQLRLKDSIIQGRDSIIQIKDAEIAVLKGDTAPAVAQKYTAMKNLADEMAKDNIRLAEEATAHKKNLTETIEKLRTVLHRETEFSSARKLMNEYSILVFVQTMMREHISTVLFPDDATIHKPEPSMEWIAAIGQGYLEAYSRISEEAKNRERKVNEILKASGL